MIILAYVLVSVPFVLIFVFFVKVMLLAKLKNYKTLLTFLHFLASPVVMGAFGGPIIVSTFIKDEEFVYGIQWYSTGIVFLCNTAYMFFLARQIDKENKR